MSSRVDELSVQFSRVQRIHSPRRVGSSTSVVDIVCHFSISSLATTDCVAVIVTLCAPGNKTVRVAVVVLQADNGAERVHHYDCAVVTDGATTAVRTVIPEADRVRGPVLDRVCAGGFDIHKG